MNNVPQHAGNQAPQVAENPYFVPNKAKAAFDASMAQEQSGRGLNTMRGAVMGNGLEGPVVDPAITASAQSTARDLLAGAIDPREVEAASLNGDLVASQALAMAQAEKSKAEAQYMQAQQQQGLGRGF